MPRKRKQGLGRKHKSIVQGKSTHVCKTPAPTTRTQYSPKRSKYHHLGTTLPVKFIDEMSSTPCNPPEAKIVCYCMAIFYFFIEVLDAPHSTHWKCKGRTIALIRKALLIHPSQRRVIRRKLEEIMRCAAEGVEFDGKIEAKNKTGRKIIISPVSVYKLLIANWMEAYYDF